jgi:hypothetical protein
VHRLEKDQGANWDPDPDPDPDPGAWFLLLIPDQTRTTRTRTLEFLGLRRFITGNMQKQGTDTRQQLQQSTRTIEKG